MYSKIVNIKTIFLILTFKLLNITSKIRNSTSYKLKKSETILKLFDKINKSKASDLDTTIMTIATELQELRKTIPQKFKASSKYVPLDVLEDNLKLKLFVRESEIQEL